MTSSESVLGQPAERYVAQIPLSDLDIDYEWNNRSMANVTQALSEIDEESTGIEGLVANILHVGQSTPVDVRPTSPPFYKLTTRKFSLVAGFRRVTAIGKIAANADLAREAKEAGKQTVIPGLSDGHVWATVHPPLSEKEAFLLNAGENTNRDGLTPPDILGIIRKASQTHGMSIAEITIALGKTHGAVRMYLCIAKLPEPILAHWQFGGEFEGVSSSKRISVNELYEISRFEKEQWTEEYRKALWNQQKKTDSSAWLEKAKSRARSAGVQMAQLQKRGFLVVTATSWFEHIAILAKLSDKRALKWADADAINKIAMSAFQRELERVDVSPIVDEDEG